VIPPVTKDEHLKALLTCDDPIGYCKNLFYNKTGSKVPQKEFFEKFTVWLRMKIRPQRPGVQVGLLQGCTYIQQFFSKKFA